MLKPSHYQRLNTGVFITEYSQQVHNKSVIKNSPEAHQLEILVLARLRPHLLSSANFSQFQSVYRKGHSTETALLEVLADDKQITVLIGLDMSAAFDTVDHRLLLDCLWLEFRVTEIPLSWL